MARAPAFTIGFIGLPAWSSMAITELNGRPVLLTRPAASPVGPIASSTSANTNALEMRWIVNSCRASPTLCERARDRHDAQPEQRGSASASAGM